MTEANEYDEVKVQILLLGDAGEIGRAIELIHRHKNVEILRILRTHNPGLDADELVDIYQDTLLAVMEAAKQNRYEADGPLMPYIATIARNKARDLERRRSVRSRQDVLANLAAKMHGTSLASDWRALAAERQESIRRIALKTLAQLPPRQRQVALVYLNLLGDDPTWDDITREIRRRFGLVITIAAAKSAWQQVRQKFRRAFERGGLKP